jgi:hypothetical protein
MAVNRNSPSGEVNVQKDALSGIEFIRRPNSARISTRRLMTGGLIVKVESIGPLRDSFDASRTSNAGGKPACHASMF